MWRQLPFELKNRPHRNVWFICWLIVSLFAHGHILLFDWDPFHQAGAQRLELAGWMNRTFTAQLVADGIASLLSYEIRITLCPSKVHMKNNHIFNTTCSSIDQPSITMHSTIEQLWINGPDDIDCCGGRDNAVSLVNMSFAISVKCDGWRIPMYHLVTMMCERRTKTELRAKFFPNSAAVCPCVGAKVAARSCYTENEKSRIRASDPI